MEKTIPDEYPHPLLTFALWFREELLQTKQRLPAVCVLSTIGLDGFPNARNVSLKEIHHPHLIFTTSLHSIKGREISKNNKVALTFWWEATNRQVRIQGVATPIKEEDANFYFSERSKSSQAVSTVSKQSEPLLDLQALKKIYSEVLLNYKEKPIPRPDHWKGFKVAPHTMEFLEFRETRFHNRIRYSQKDGDWHVMQVQP